MPNYREIAETLYKAVSTGYTTDVMSQDDIIELAEWYAVKARLVEQGDIEAALEY